MLDLTDMFGFYSLNEQMIFVFIFSVEVDLNGQITKEIQQEELAIRQMFMGLSMKREVGRDYGKM